MNPLTPLPHDATRDACAAVHGDLQAPPAAPAPPASGLETGEGGSRVLVIRTGASAAQMLEALSYDYDDCGGPDMVTYTVTITRL